MSSAGWAYVVSRPHSALHLGHVAWGCTRRRAGELVYAFGSIEDSRRLPIARPAVDFWQESAPQQGLGGLVAWGRAGAPTLSAARSRISRPGPGWAHRQQLPPFASPKT